MKKIKSFLSRAVHTVFGYLCIMNNLRSVDKSNKVVLLRLDALGDFVLWQDSAKEFKHKYPQAKIILICQSMLVEFAKTLPYFDDVFAIDLRKLRHSFRYFFGIKKHLGEYVGATVIQTVYARTWMMDIIVSMIPAHRKITVYGSHDNFPFHKGFYDNIYDKIEHISSEWDLELNRNAKFMRGIGFKEFRSDLPQLPEYVIGLKEIKDRYFVVVLGTGSHAREWDPACYGVVARHVCDRYHLRCCLLGIPQDRPLVEGFKNGYGTGCTYIDLIGKTGIPEYVQLIRGAELVISGDTSAAHIAAAVRTRSIAIIGGWHYGRFFPYDTEIGADKEYFPRVCYQYMSCYQCNRKDVTDQCRLDEKYTGRWSCILAVMPEMVIKEVDAMLSDT